jgi:23S rRNA pseudouridine955/2504/2580 synthase
MSPMKTAANSLPDSQDIVTANAVTSLVIDIDQAGQRLDNFLIARLKGVPKSKIYNIIRKGEVRINKGRVKPEYKLLQGDLLRIPPVRTAETGTIAKPSHQMTNLLASSILYEDDGLMVVDKPPGLAVHGGSGVTLGLIETLRQMRPELHHLELVHRLDKDTSGCIMIAKKRSYLRHLQAALRDKSSGGIVKTYQALVIGDWPKSLQHVTAPLHKTETADGNRIVRVTPEGKPSLTEFKLLKRFEGIHSNIFSLIEARPISGRTHQIRVHAQYAGHSLVGDAKYGNDLINSQMKENGVKRLFLHASSLEFLLPNATKPIRVESPLPDDLSFALKQLTLL